MVKPSYDSKLNSSEKSAELGPFPSPPADAWAERFREHIRKTGAPESFPDICSNPPELEQEHQIVTRFMVDAKSRPNGDPCALCSGGHPKFYAGILLWSADGHIRLIGHECAATHFGAERIRTIHDEHSRRILERDHQNFLLDALPLVPQMLSACALLLPTAKASAVQHALIKRKAPKLFQRLRTEMKTHDGALTVGHQMRGPQQQGMRGSGGISNFSVVRVAYLQGATALRSSFHPHKDIDLVRARLVAVRTPGPEHGPDEEFARAEFVATLSLDELKFEVSSIRDAHRKLCKISHDLADFRRFFDDENLSAIDRWGRHPENDISVEARRAGNRIIIRHALEDEVNMELIERVAVQLPSLPPIGTRL